MGLITDMAQSYRTPRQVFRHRLGQGENEGGALITLMIACALIFVAQWPRLSREAFETGQELQMLMGATLLGWLFIMPLVLYTLAGIVGFILRILGRPVTGYGARMALFWGLLCATPLWMLWGLTVGFVGLGSTANVVGILALGALIVFWGIFLSTAAQK